MVLTQKHKNQRDYNKLTKQMEFMRGTSINQYMPLITHMHVSLIYIHGRGFLLHIKLRWEHRLKTKTNQNTLHMLPSC